MGDDERKDGRENGEWIPIEESNAPLSADDGEQYTVAGGEVVGVVRRILKQANVRQVTVRNADGANVLVIPLPIGLAGLAVLPLWPALGALTSFAVGAALLADYTILVERRAAK